LHQLKNKDKGFTQHGTKTQERRRNVGLSFSLGHSAQLGWHSCQLNVLAARYAQENSLVHFSHRG
jgi:hypothetical protein